MILTDLRSIAELDCFKDAGVGKTFRLRLLDGDLTWTLHSGHIESRCTVLPSIMVAIDE